MHISSFDRIRIDRQPIPGVLINIVKIRMRQIELGLVCITTDNQYQDY